MSESTSASPPRSALGEQISAHAERSRLRELRRSERARIEAIAATDAQVLVMQDDAFLGLVKTIDRAYRHARRIRAVHARDRDRALARHAVVDGNHASSIDSPGNVVLLLAGGDAAVALDAALGVAQKFHSGHDLVPSRLAGMAALGFSPWRPGTASSWIPASSSPSRSRRSW